MPVRSATRLKPAWVELNNVVSEYNEGAAKEWCIANMRPALKLDAKKFEAAVISNDVPADIATANKQPVVKIATKL